MFKSRHDSPRAYRFALIYGLILKESFVSYDTFYDEAAVTCSASEIIYIFNLNPFRTDFLEQ